MFQPNLAEDAVAKNECSLITGEFECKLKMLAAERNTW